MSSDARALATYRSGLAAAVSFATSHTALFPDQRLEVARVLPRGDREAVWTTWQAFLDYLVATDSVAEYYEDFWKLPSAERDQALAIRYAAFLSPYRWALELIARAENDPGLPVVLDDPVPELGLPKGSYAALKLRFLNVQRAAEFAAFEALRGEMHLERFPALETAIKADASVVWQAGKGHGEALTLANALAAVKGTTTSVAFPVQAGIAEWMGDEKVRRQHVDLITLDQVHALHPRLQPGDVLLERREWYLSNIGLPGYWPHAALFVGTPAERATYFAEPEVLSWIKAQGQADGNFEALLTAREPNASASCRATENGHPVRILEAMSEGVVFTSIEHSAAADSLAVLRPRLSKAARAAAILRAFHYAGRPYDFDFDFLTDSALVCTELVYKAYEPAPDKPGLRLPVEQVMGRTTMPANIIVRLYDAEAGTKGQQLDLILFLDGDEAARVAREASDASFRESWKRPKWFILTQH
jgi:hypothetical protein